jgi:16S rRNA processing protein RimM
MPAEQICLAVIAGAHGVRGLVKLKCFTEAAEAVTAYGPLSDQRGRRFDLTLKGQVKGVLLAAIAGVEDREAAQALRGTRLYVPRSALPEPEAEAFYYADLIGLAAESPTGEALGRVVQVHDFGAGELLEIEGEGRPALIVPFTRAAVPSVDLAAGRLVVDPPHEVVAGPEKGEARDA